MAISKVVYGGNTLIDLTADTVKADKILKSYTAHGADGEPITGTCTFDADTQDATATDAEILNGKISYVRGVKVTGKMKSNGAVSGTISTKTGKYTVPQGYHDGSGTVQIDATEQAKLTPANIREGVTILGVAGTMSPNEGEKAQEKTVTPTTAVQTVVPDEGYTCLSSVTVNAMPTATQATPSINVNSSGLITASATQSAGYVSAGTKSATKQLTTQAAQTIIPSTSDKTIASGRYLTGTQTIKGDSNLKAENIKSGVSIFGVAGNYEGSGGGGSSGAGTCTVTINQVWGGNDDPQLLRAFVLYYNAATAEPLSTVLTSVEDYEPQHSITFTVLKNSFVVILAGGISGTVVYSASVSGGIMKEYKYGGAEGNIPFPIGSSVTLYQFIPTEDTAVFTITSP